MKTGKDKKIVLQMFAFPELVKIGHVFDYGNRHMKVVCSLSENEVLGVDLKAYLDARKEFPNVKIYWFGCETFSH